MNGWITRRRHLLSWRPPGGARRILELGRRTCLMGVLNITPDSFYDGGRYAGTRRAVARALELEAGGADIIDIGGESSRPGASPVPAREQIRRIVPVIEKLAGRLRIPISVDTTSAEVARAAVKAGAEILNDISAFRFDPEMVEAAASAPGPVVIMHMRGRLGRMPARPRYRDVVGEIGEFFERRLAELGTRGIDRGRLIIDPGLGFGKSAAHNLEIVAGLSRLGSLGRPLLLGPSRKSFIGKVLGAEPEERLWGTVGVSVAAVTAGAHLLRVHDPRPVRDAVRMIDEMLARAAKKPNREIREC